MPAASILLLSSTLALICYYVGKTLWSVYFGSLSGIPGPKLAAATRLVLISHKARGRAEHWRLKLHLVYGDIVRVAPNEISFATGAAWNDIYGYSPGSKVARCPKDPTFYTDLTEAPTIVTARQDDHTRQRKCFSHAFSDKALREQESLLQKYTSQFISNIEQVKDGFDIVKQYNYLTFDIMADLAFGESLGCLAASEYVPWISAMLGAMRVFTILGELNHYPSLRGLLAKLIPRSITEKGKQHLQFASDRVDKRLSRETSRPDIWSFVLAAEDKDAQLTRKEMHANAGFFMLAGSDTSAVLLSALTRHLLVNPDKMNTLVREVRDKFASADQINSKDLLSLNYLTACIQEGLRIHPSAAIGFPRVIPKGGGKICGLALPEGTSVYVHPLSTFHNPKNFSRPDEFLPQRWLSKSYKFGTDAENNREEFAQDDRSCFQPFSVGPSNCIGVNLAWQEIRLILAHTLWHFDLELALDEDTWRWDSQRVFNVWEKEPLIVKAKPAER